MPRSKRVAFQKLALDHMPDPRWKPEQAKKGVPKPPHPCISVIALLDVDGNPWVYDEITGFRRLYAFQDD